MPQPLMLKKLKLTGTMKTYHNSRTNTKKDALFSTEYWNAKVESQVISRITGKFGLGVQNEAGQRLTVFSREHVGHSKYPFAITQETTLYVTSPHGQYQDQIDYVLCS